MHVGGLSVESLRQVIIAFWLQNHAGRLYHCRRPLRKGGDCPQPQKERATSTAQLA